MAGKLSIPPFEKGVALLAFTCANAHFDVVASFFERAIRRDYAGLWTFDRAPLELPYPEAKPGGVHYPEIAIWRPSCHQDRCMLTTNYADGFARFLRAYLGAMPVDFTEIRATAANSSWPVFTFVHYEKGIERRCVQVLKDDPKWQFFQRGAPLEFENTEMYSAHRIKDRLTAESIVRYLSALGYDLGNPAFWQSDEDAFYCRQREWRHHVATVPGPQ